MAKPVVKPEVKQEVQPEVKPKVEMVDTKETYVIVKLVGNHNERIGEHFIHLGKNYVTFVDGVANVTNETAVILKKMGYVK